MTAKVIQVLDKSLFGNDQYDLIKIVAEDDKYIYYYDGFRRYCYLGKDEEGTVWKWMSPEEVKEWVRS